MGRYQRQEEERMDEIERKINMRKRADIREKEKEKNFKRTSMKKIRRHE
jgi:hypothetical protein